MSNTNVLRFELRERAYLSTKIFEEESIPYNKEPGQTLLLTVDPIGALLSDTYDYTQNKPQSDDQMNVYARAPHATVLAVTLSRFRKFKYIGTRVGLRPAATTGQIDVAHISEPAGGGNNYVHPYDVSNMIHFRRWIGGNIDLPHINVGYHVDPAHPTSQSGKWDRKQAMDLDLAWMSDPRFMHINVSQGFDLFARPMRATVESAPEGATSMWLYGRPDTFSLKTSWDTTHVGDADKRRPIGRTMLSGGHIVPDGWTTNPLSCFWYNTAMDDTIQDAGRPNSAASNEYYLLGVNYKAPWFTDYFDVDGFAGSVSQALDLVRQRYLNPVCIMRLPPAYGTVMYYTLYMVHYFAVAQPYLTNTSWVASHLDVLAPGSGQSGNVETVSFDDTRCGMHLRPSGIIIHQAVCPDPQSAAETGYTADFAALHGLDYAGALRMSGTDEPTDGMDEMADAFAEFAEQPSTADIPSEAPAKGGAGESQGGVEEDDS